MKKLIAGALTAAMVLGTVTPVAVFADEKQDLTLGLMLITQTSSSPPLKMLSRKQQKMQGMK